MTTRTLFSALGAFSIIYATTSFAMQFDCRHNQYVIEACQKVRGRLSMYANSNIVLWPVGTKRLLGLYHPELESQYPELYEKLRDSYTVFADFEVCRYGHDEPGHMMSACIADMSNPKYFTYEEMKKLGLY